MEKVVTTAILAAQTIGVTTQEQWHLNSRSHIPTRDLKYGGANKILGGTKWLARTLLSAQKVPASTINLAPPQRSWRRQGSRLQKESWLWQGSRFPKRARYYQRHQPRSRLNPGSQVQQCQGEETNRLCLEPRMSSRNHEHDLTTSSNRISRHW